ncbi:hypothetical protein SNE25_21200 [Mucilaginibacter sabulilitoris]|uniref:Uncharacterized protein n=1 Tax=Mucilaginibacter sabulilitoris TaxID=1173583 RepID=A0ABZ0TI35_9SPHI|nr:hypothetical protein [Mucilaginibacter sabulilitoris]WPU91838.1 hypothetical protein SNE25_21200 [Mucilaginibacter sabulilitoris]
MKDIKELLQLFVSDPDAWQDWSKTPFRIIDKVYATDRHVLVIIPAELAPEVEDLKDYKPENVLKVIPELGPVIKTITAKDILTALKSVPTIREDQECKACKGDGEVEWEFIHDGERYREDFECPLSDGEGSFPDEDGKMIPDPDKCITIGMASFAPKYIKKLYQLCQFFDLAEIDLISQRSEDSPSLFSKDDISLLIMPVLEKESVHTIK